MTLVPQGHHNEGVSSIPVWYTFGNHMHWVDMEWLWGYHVLPGSVRDMLRFCRETGMKGNVNFDGIGYEKLASEDPEAFAELNRAVHDGLIELVGCSYGQPYGLFHGGESNVRQRVYGSRVVMRLLGMRPRTFWEEEFDFFPQLPQMLRGCGFEFASLFFQWTWHTPEVPKEDVPVVWWEGQDGSRLLCATRNRLNLHQWPEDMDALLAELAADSEASPPPILCSSSPPLILQWLELMPSPDWMCRSELLIPKMRELLADQRFEIIACTLGEYLDRCGAGVPAVVSSGDNTAQLRCIEDNPPQAVLRDWEFVQIHSHAREGHGNHGRDARATPPTRRYSMSDVWHGMSLGKNGDNMRRLSREAESTLLSAETLAAIAGLFGRPYAQWDVYPTWELEEAWRELLSAQHHDNDECEGLCGHVGRFSYERSLSLGGHVGRRSARGIARHLGGSVGTVFPTWIYDSADGDQQSDRDTDSMVFLNPLGWSRTVRYAIDEVEMASVTLPPFGGVVARAGPESDSVIAGLTDPNLQLGSDLKICDWRPHGFPDGVFAAPSLGMRYKQQGQVQELERSTWPSQDIEAWVDVVDSDLGLVASFYSTGVRPDPGLNGALCTEFHLSFRPRIIADQPYGVSEINPIERGLKKYPTGDWMTSEQWFEEVARPFTSLTFVDLIDDDNPDRGLLICHDGSQQWFFDEGDNSVRVVLNAYDPWDEHYFRSEVQARFLLVPHGPMKNSEKWKTAQEFVRPALRAYFLQEQDALETLSAEPSSTFSACSIDAENVALTAFYRETRDSAKGQERHAADELGVEYPYVLRLVELDGVDTLGTITVAGTVAGAIKANLLGEPVEPLEVKGNSAGAPCSTIKVRLRPYEIATVYLDIVEGRKEVRDLDSKRSTWAQVHRV